MLKRILAIVGVVALIATTMLPIIATPEYECPVCGETVDCSFTSIHGVIFANCMCGYFGPLDQECPACHTTTASFYYDEMEDDVLVDCMDCNYYGSYFDTSGGGGNNQTPACPVCTSTDIDTETVNDVVFITYCMGCGYEGPLDHQCPHCHTDMDVSFSKSNGVWYVDCMNCNDYFPYFTVVQTCAYCNETLVADADGYCTNCWHNTSGDLHPAYEEGLSAGYTGAAARETAALAAAAAAAEAHEAAAVAAAETAAYQEGYEDGVATAESSIFGYCTATARIVYSDNTPTATVTFNLNQGYGSAWFDSLEQMAAIEDHDEALESVTITLTWDADHYWDWNAYPILLSGTSEVSDATITTINDITYSLDYDQISGMREAAITPASYNTLMVSTYSLYIGRPGDNLHEITMFSGNKQFMAGWAQGKTEGYREGESDGFASGLEAGIARNTDAYESGYLDGLKVSESGNWRELITAVIEAPVNTFQSLFNFQILGMDMRAAIGSILAICVVLIIVKKVIL